jgi:large subunit ribosomal protein L9e
MGNLTVATGKLTKNLNHLAVNFSHPKKDVINIELHHGARKNVATLRTVRTLINNLIIGVTKGFKYKMRYVYAHFPINVNVDKNNETGLYEVEIRYVTSILLEDCRSGLGETEGGIEG